MTAKSACQYCGGHLEFDLSEFEQQGETATERTGQGVDCPHCGKLTLLRLPKIQLPKPKIEPEKPLPVAHPVRTITCYDCGGKISPSALFCPTCGKYHTVPFSLVLRVVWMVIMAGLVLQFFYLLFNLAVAEWK